MASMGSAILGLMGTKDPRQQLMAQLLGSTAGQPPSGSGTPAPVGAAPGTTPPGAGVPAPAQPPAAPAQPEAYQSPPQLLELYSSLQEYGDRSNSIDKGIGMIAASLAQPENRQAMLGAAGGVDNSKDMDLLMQIQQQQTAMSEKAAAQKQALAIATQLGIPPEQAAYLDANGQLDDMLAESMKPKDPGLTYRSMTPEEITERGLDPTKNYEIGSNGNVQTIGDNGVSVVVNNEGAVPKYDNSLIEAADKDIIDVSLPAAKASLSTIASVGQARAALDADGGIITGSALGPWENEIRKVAADALGIDDPATVNTAQYEAAQADVIRNKVKELGTGNAISNADLEFTQRSVGAGGTVPQEALPRILRIMEMGSYNQVLQHNQRVDAQIEARGDTITPQAKAILEGYKLPVPEISIPTPAITELKAAVASGDAAAIEEFNEAFGPGAAETLLLVP